MRIAIVGASGYSGAELVRLLLQHPACQTLHLFSSGLQNSFVSQLEEGCHYCDYAELYPAFTGAGVLLYGLPNTNETWCDFYQSYDLVFLATPHAASVQLLREYFRVEDRFGGKQAKIIDLSGALRLDDPKLYAQWYGEETLEEALLRRGTYGLSELFAEKIRRAEIVANPGCYATASVLALAPLAGLNMLGRVRIDAKSGVSGSGKKVSDATQFSQSNESLSLYKLHQHQHIPEIEMALQHCANLTAGRSGGRSHIEPLTFTTHLLPITRGIMVTCYIECATGEEELCQIYRDFYCQAPFVQFREGSLPQIQDVAFSNRCDIGLGRNPHNNDLVVVAVLDNLLKGAAGQAVQNMNLLFGWEPERSLPRVGALP